MSLTTTMQMVGGNTPFNTFKQSNNNMSTSYIRANITDNAGLNKSYLTLKFQPNSLTADDDIKNFEINYQRRL